MSKIITCEQVSDGHPDKICDQIADAIVTDCLKHDKNARVAIECLFKDTGLVISGELTSTHKPDYRKLVNEVFERIGADRLGDISPTMEPTVTETWLDILNWVKEQSPDIAMGVDKGGAGDQGIMYGYATNETPELMPIPYMVATRFLEILKENTSGLFLADAKAQVSFDYDLNRITTFLCSVQHREDADYEQLKNLVKGMMIRAASEYELNTDFEVLINPTGRFVIGGSFADCGVTGRKLACDTYGGVGRIGGGALSGKDPSKVDRSAAYAARQIARDIVKSGFADKCEIQIAYAIGVVEPVSIFIDTFGTEYMNPDAIVRYVRENYDLSPRGIIERLRLLDTDYNLVSAYGHFGKRDLPWES